MTEHNPERWELLQQLFHAALEHDPDQRDEYVAHECAGDGELQSQLQQLLADEQKAAELMESLAATGANSSNDDDLTPNIPRQIGRYSIKRVIASGGMGTIYEAVQDRPRRTVAVKVMRAGLASRTALRRFEYESQLLARLRHPDIAQVFEAGTYNDGTSTVPYFAMEYIPNAKPITEYAKQKHLGIRERLELFARVGDAVHHGHQKGIIHRDIKPSNILIGSDGRPRVIDFGVARSTDSDNVITALQTQVGQLIGTVQYMSPEQCEADPHDLDTRSDIYALGVVMYELLGDKLPYDLTDTAVHEATRVIREQTPPRLSTLDSQLGGDVETIVLKALEKERDRRYRSAAELADDIRRYLSGDGVSEISLHGLCQGLVVAPLRPPVVRMP